MKNSKFFTFLVFFFLIIFSNIFSFNSTNNCVLNFDFNNSSSGTDPKCSLGNCCGLQFKKYLQALAYRTNQTGLIFLDQTDQDNCFSSIHNFSICGFQKLTKGVNGNCSNYSVSDVVNKLGTKLRSLINDCEGLSSDNASDSDCNRCLRTWDDISLSSNHTNDDEICRFAVLIVVISQRFEDRKWVEAVYKCLRDNPFHQGNVTFQAYSLDNDTISPLPSSSSYNHGIKGREKFRSKEGLYATIAGVAAMATSVIATCCVLCRKKARKVYIPTNKVIYNNSFYDESASQIISLNEIYSATDNLSPMNIIGEGIAGKVYKGVLTDGQHVAVKHITNDGQMETFVREVKSLSHIRHQNLVSLLGHCDGEDDCFLVYELCHNGNLSHWLFGKDKNLSWIRRLEIAIDSARALWFLHTYPDGCIVHRDIKPTNILLCKDFQAKVSDFGLSKMMSMGESFVSSEVRGTFGYVDPEYQKNRHVNASGDVYSFGIVLLQILSGQRVINMDLQRPMHVNKLAKSVIKGGDINDFADKKMNGEYCVEAFKLILKLALSCTGIKLQRPSMEQVVKTLEKALQISANLKPIIRPAFYTR